MRQSPGARIASAPFLPFLSSTGRVSLLQAIALLPVVVVDFSLRGPLLLPVLLTALIVALFWENLFAFMRHNEPSLHGLTTALTVAVFAPLDVAGWQLAVALSLGVVLGELIFGGRGFSFVQPAAAALALLSFSFPQVELQAMQPALTIAALPGAILLLIAGLISWRVIVAAAIIAAVIFALAGEAGSTTGLAVALSVGLVFLIADPVSAACTNPGRWLYGALAGFLVAVFAGFTMDGPLSQAVVFAALLSSVFAPLIDHLVVLANAYQRERRRGKADD